MDEASPEIINQLLAAGQQAVVLEREGMRLARLRRFERGMVIITAEGRLPAVGTQLQLWLRAEGSVYVFRSSVLRIGVSVPERSQQGLALGFLSGRKMTLPTHLQLSVLLPDGSELLLQQNNCSGVELKTDEVLLALEPDSRLLLSDRSRCRLEIKSTTEREQIHCRVLGVLRAGEIFLCQLRIEDISDPEVHRRMVEQYRKADSSL